MIEYNRIDVARSARRDTLDAPVPHAGRLDHEGLEGGRGALFGIIIINNMSRIINNIIITIIVTITIIPLEIQARLQDEAQKAPGARGPLRERRAMSWDVMRCDVMWI